MSVLVRAALLGGLAYVVSRAVRRSDAGSDYLSGAEPGRNLRGADQDLDARWQNAEEPTASDALGG
jgi:hypothetical protein